MTRIFFTNDERWTRWVGGLVAMAVLLSGTPALAGQAKSGHAAPASSPKAPATDEPPPLPSIEKLVLHEDGSLVGACEICVLVLQNRAKRQPYLCRSLKNPDYQKNCVEVMESLAWWVGHEEFWWNLGCERTSGADVVQEQPCPAHAACGWIEQPHTNAPYCPADSMYAKPEEAGRE